MAVAIALNHRQDGMLLWLFHRMDAGIQYVRIFDELAENAFAPPHGQEKLSLALNERAVAAPVIGILGPATTS